MANHATTTKFIRSGNITEIEAEIDVYLATIDTGKTIHTITSFKDGGEYAAIIVHVT